MNHRSGLKSHTFSTVLGEMTAIADRDWLYLLDFSDAKRLQDKIALLERKLGVAASNGQTDIHKCIQNELKEYFSHQRQQFNTPTYCIGTIFQKNVWAALTEIPFGECQSYLDIARVVNSPYAYRAVAQTNANNRLAIIIPCHRVINHNGKMGGYSSGLKRKAWLLQHEKMYLSL